MSWTINIRKTVEEFFYFLLAFVLTSKAPIRFFEFHGFSSISYWLGTISLYGAILFAFLIVIKRKDYVKYTLCTVVFFIVMYLYQRFIVPTGSFGDYWNSFCRNAIAGCLCGIALSNPLKLVHYAGRYAILYGILLIPEPITRSLLGYTSMSLGYTMAPLTIWLLLYWYYMGKHKKLIMLLCIALGIMTVFFTSRGCGLSILIAAFVVFLHNSKNSPKTKRTILMVGPFVAIVMLFVLKLLADYLVQNSSFALLQGAAFQKLMNGMISDDNGRFGLMALAFSLFRKNWFYGVGIAADRDILGYVFPHNIVIEILLHFGLIFGIVILVFYWKKVVKAVRYTVRKEYSLIIPALCCIYWIRLLFSDSYLSNSFGLMFIFGFSIQLLCKKRTGELDE